MIAKARYLGTSGLACLQQREGLGNLDLSSVNDELERVGHCLLRRQSVALNVRAALTIVRDAVFNLLAEMAD
jgi:hypothetical protein